MRAHLARGELVLPAVTLLCIAVVALIGWNVLLAREAAKTAAARANEALAQLAGHDAEADIATVDAFLRGLGAVLPAEGPARLTAAQYAVLSALAGEEEGLGSVVVLDRAGRPLHAIAPADGAVSWPPDGFANAPWFIEAMRQPSGLVVGAPTTGISEPEPVLPIARAVTGSDGATAVLMAELLVSSLERSLGALDLGPEGVVRLVWGRDTVVLRLPPGDGRAGKATDASLAVPGRRAGSDGTGAGPTDVAEEVSVVRPLGQLPLTLTVGIGDGDLARAWRRQAIGSLAITAILCSAMFGVAMLLRREMARRSDTERDLWLLSETDPLTGLGNRRRFERVIAIELRRAHRSRAPLSLLMVDIDRFKLINDRFGHAYGDRILKVVAERLVAAVRRPGDLVARVGGDEFAVLLPETDGAGALAVAEAARKRVESHTFPQEGGATVTVGIATVERGGAMAPADLVAAADRALYAAKEAGRNRSVQWTGDAP